MRTNDKENYVSNVTGGHQESGCGGSSQKEDGDGTPRLNVPHLQDLIGKEALQYRPSVRLSQVNKSTGMVRQISLTLLSPLGNADPTVVTCTINFVPAIVYMYHVCI